MENLLKLSKLGLVQYIHVSACLRAEDEYQEDSKKESCKKNDLSSLVPSAGLVNSTARLHVIRVAERSDRNGHEIESPPPKKKKFSDKSPVPAAVECDK